MKKCDLICCAVLSILFFSCNKEPKTIPVTGITINTSSLTLVERETSDLIATISPKNADNQTVIWSTSDGSVASVSNGKVTAIKAGESIITAKSDDGGYTAICTVTVNPATIEVASISLSKNELALTEGESETLSATVLPDDASDKTVKWSSSDESIASVSNGKVTAKKEGTATILAQAGGKSVSCSVTVSKNVIHVESISFNVDQKRLKCGEEFESQVVIVPDKANDYSLKFSSANPSIATVSDNGIIKGISAGKTSIIAEAEGKTAFIPITVFEKDIVYAASFVADVWGAYTSNLWKDGEALITLKDYTIQNFVIADNQPSVIVTHHASERPYICNPYILVGNRFNKYEDLNYSYFASPDGSFYTNGSWYSFINHSNADGSWATPGVWKDSIKLFDIGKDSDVSPTSYYSINSLFVDGDDIYYCGSILEPLSIERFFGHPTVWKNGIVLKEFNLQDYGITSHGEIVSMEIENGKRYYLVSCGSSSCHYSVFDDSGKVYDLYPDHPSTVGLPFSLKAYNGHLYTAITIGVNGKNVWVVFKDGKEIFTIPEVTQGYFDIIDGDIYSIVIQSKNEKIDNYNISFSSVSTYRNDIKERTLVDFTGLPVYIGPIKVINEK